MNLENYENSKIEPITTENSIETIDENSGKLEMQEFPMLDVNVNCMNNINIPYRPSHMMSPNKEQNKTSIAEAPDMNISDVPVEEPSMFENIQFSDNTTMMRGYFEDSDGYSYTSYYYRQFDDADEILEKIERYNPGIFGKLVSSGVPFPTAYNIVRRIVKLTLNYYK